jgi:predicted nucleotidyltransferase component of viral defense system
VIPAAAITAWSATRPWPTRAAVEQDLLLARTIVAIYNHPLLADELVFRGGTCLHQVVLPQPLRYSEDLDFVRRTHSGIGALLDALRDVAAEIGLEVAGSNIGTTPKLRMRAASEDDPNVPLRIKVEINTHETSPAQPTTTVPFTVASHWFAGTADVRTFTTAELVATKIRALYQRKKGRDLFDMWLALTQLGLTGDELLAAFGPYRPEGLTATLAEANLRDKMSDRAFRTDLEPLVGEWTSGGALVSSVLATARSA